MPPQGSSTVMKINLIAQHMFGLNIFYSSQVIRKDPAERKAMFSNLHDHVFWRDGILINRLITWNIRVISKVFCSDKEVQHLIWQALSIQPSSMMTSVFSVFT